MNLYNIRTRKGISQVELANAVGVNKSAVCHWERNNVYPTADKLQPIANFLGCTVDELLADPAPVTEPVKETNEL